MPDLVRGESIIDITQKRIFRDTEELATKRQKMWYPNTTIENKQSEGKVLPLSEIRTHYSKLEVQLMLENQGLRLESKLNTVESKFKTRLIIMEKDMRKTVAELRTENLLLKKDISRLEKINFNFQSMNDHHAGVAKVELDRRRKRFPWLPIPILEETRIQSKQNRETTITALPDDVALIILMCLPDEDLFVFRGLNSLFYEAFYLQENDVDIKRCLWLAKRGRKFTNLREISDVDGKFTVDDFRVLGPYNFPKLEVFNLYDSSTELLQPHGYLKEFNFFENEFIDLRHLSDWKFPALGALAFFKMRVDLRNLSGHKSLKFILFDSCVPTLEEIQNLSKESFPRLQHVAIDKSLERVPGIDEHFKQQGIELYYSDWDL